MALQIWLPLNGNLNNQGLNNTTFTGSTTFEAGKLGQAGVFGTAAKRAISSATVTLNSQVTIAFWIKIKTWVNWGRIFNLYNSDKTNTISCVSNTSTDKRIGTQVSKNGTNLTDSYNGSFDLNTWYHFAMVVNGTTKQHYINGSLVGTATLSDSMVTTNYTVMCGGTADNGTPVDMDINDFRVYDNALSPKEIEILSRGLVCHYPLNGGGRSGNNLLRHTNIDKYGLGYMTTYNSGTVTVDTTETFGAKSTIRIQPSSSSTSSGGINEYNSVVGLLANKQYCYSCWIKSTVDDTFAFNSLGHFQTYTSSGAHNRTIQHEGDNIPANQWTKVYITFTPTVDCTFYSFFLYFASTSQKIWVSDVKLEEGDHPTSWMPNSTDDEYSSLGYNSTTEYDVSGYGNNGTKQYITYETDTPRYSVSSVLSGSSTRISNTTINIGNEWSYGLWFKSAATTHTWEGLVILNNNGGDTDIQLGFYINPNSSQIQTTANGQYNMISHTYDDKWHHLFATFDGTTLKTYKDGELVNTKTITNSLLSRSNLTFGARYRGGTTFDCLYKGSVSDFRLYATALSATQIAELYNTAVSVANNGTLMGYELVEV